MAELIANKVIVSDNKTLSQLIQKGFGEKKEKELVLDLMEAVYLMEKEKIEVEKNGKKLSKTSLMQLAEKKEKEFYNKFLVYSDLRERGFCVKTGFKFGFDLRVYPRGKKPGEEHTQWVIAVKSQSDKMNMIQLSRKVRLSGNIRTKMLIAVVDSENDINYYEIERITP